MRTKNLRNWNPNPRSYFRFIQQIYKRADASLRKTVFLDRDGTLVNEIAYLSDSSQIHFLPGVTKGLKRLNAHNIVLIVISNQPVIARGMATIREVRLIHDTLVIMLNKEHAYIHAVYFCPHHPEKYHPDIPLQAMKYRIPCQCRKPKLALFKKAIKDFHVNLEKAFVVGNRSIDIEAGKALGAATILIQTDSNKDDALSPKRPDFIAPDFDHAVDIIINR